MKSKSLFENFYVLHTSLYFLRSHRHNYKFYGEKYMATRNVYFQSNFNTIPYKFEFRKKLIDRWQISMNLGKFQIL